MDRTARNILISMALIAAGIISVVYSAFLDLPIFTRIISVTVGIAGVLFSAAMRLVYRLFLDRKKANALALSSIIAGAAGIVLIIDGAFYFLDPKYLVLADLVVMGAVTVAFAAFLHKAEAGIWISVLIAGVGGVVAGVLALINVQVSLLVGSVTASVILIYPLCVEAHKKNLDENGRKIVTIREQDIEIIDEE